MKHNLFRLLKTRPGGLPMTSQRLLKAALAQGNGGPYPDQFTAGSITLNSIDMGPEIERVDQYGIGPKGLYCLSVWNAEGSECRPISQDAVEVFYLPLAAKNPEDVRSLFRVCIFDIPLGREVLTQLARVEAAGPLLWTVWNDLLDVNIAVAQSAVAAHADGNWLEPPTPATLVINAEVRSLLVKRARPHVQIFRSGWFNNEETWMANAFGGTVIAICQLSGFHGPFFLAGKDVTLAYDEMPISAVEALQHLWFEPVEPENTVLLLANLDKGVRASQKSKDCALEKLVSQLGRLICWEGSATSAD